MSADLDLSRPEVFEELWRALVDAFSSVEQLDVFVRLKLGFPLAQVAVGSQNNRVLDLVDWMHSNGRARELARKALERSPDNPALLAFERQYMPTVFSRGARAALVKLLSDAGFSSAVLMDAAVKSLPTGFDAGRLPTDPGASEDGRWTLVDALEGLQGSNGVAGGYLLLELVTRLALRTTTPHDKALREWGETRVAQLGLPGTTLPAIKRHVDKERLIPPFLVVKLLAGDDRCAMQVWLGWKLNEPLVSLHADDAPRPLQEQEQTLGAVLVDPRVMTAMRDTGVERLNIEFVLACDELERPVEHWSVTNGDDAEPLHLLHDVVVRPLERVYAAVQASQYRSFAGAAMRWEQRWRTFASLAGTAFPGSVLWVRQDTQHANKELKLSLSEDKHVCLALTVMPNDKQPRQSATVKQGLSFGIPVALWLRGGCSPHGEVDTDFSRMLTARDEICGQVRKMRGKSYVHANHLGEHVVLLWDNWDHRPPDAIESDLEAPEAAG